MTGVLLFSGCSGGGGQGGPARCTGAKEEYRAWQRIANATVGTRHTRGTDGAELHTESYVHAERNLLVVRVHVAGGRGAEGEEEEELRVVLWTVGQGVGPAHTYPNKAIRIPPNISDPSLIPACAFPTRAGCIQAASLAVGETTVILMTPPFYFH